MPKSHSADSRTRPTVLGYPRSSLVVPGLAALGGLVFAVWKPGVVRSAFGSPRSIGFTVAVVGVVALAGWLLPRFRCGPLLTGAVQAVPVILAGVLTIAPAFRDVTVDESVPADVAAALVSPAAVPTPPAPPADAGPSAGVPPTVAPTTAPAPATPPAPAAVELGQAELVGIDHDATGLARLIRLADGSHLVRLENLDVEPGPDYFVELVPGADRQSPDGGVRLDSLKGNQGNQNYPVGSDVEVRTPTTVLIWCRAFAVPIANATIGG